MTNSPYELLGKEEGIRKLADAFYNAMDTLPEAEGIRKMHADSLDNVKQKLFEYLNGWLGGPHIYREKYGTICLTDPHKPYAIGESERDQWVLCWDQALKDVDASQQVIDIMKEPIYRLATFMMNHHG